MRDPVHFLCRDAAKLYQLHCVGICSLYYVNDNWPQNIAFSCNPVILPSTKWANTDWFGGYGGCRYHGPLYYHPEINTECAHISYGTHSNGYDIETVHIFSTFQEMYPHTVLCRALLWIGTRRFVSSFQRYLSAARLIFGLPQRLWKTLWNMDK